MRLLIIFLQVVLSVDVRWYESSSRVPDCECGWGWFEGWFPVVGVVKWHEPHPEWSEWTGCNHTCSDEPIVQTRERGCEKSQSSFGFTYCPIKNKHYYKQLQFKACDSIPPCGE